MRLPRFGIGWLMTFVAVVALNLAVVRASYRFYNGMGENDNRIDVMVTGSLPMLNLLAIGLVVWLRGNRMRPFLLGFEVFGSIALALYIAAVCSCCHTWVRPYLFRLQNPVFNAIGRSRAHAPIFRFTATVILVWPQIALALIGGLLVRWATIRRRRPG